MTRRKTLTDNMVAKLKPGPKRITLPDPEFIGHYVRITPAGAKSYVAVAREPYVKKQVWATIGSTDHYSIEEARNLAREAIKRIKAGLSAFEPPPAKPDSFKAVAEKHLKRHVRANRLRSEKQIERILNKYVYPVWGTANSRASAAATWPRSLIWCRTPAARGRPITCWPSCAGSCAGTPAAATTTSCPSAPG